MGKTGEIHKTNNGLEFTIINWIDSREVTVRFIDGSLLSNKPFSSIKKYNPKNINIPSVEGVGYFGNGNFSKAKHEKYYNIWRSMLIRCYNEKFKTEHPTYIGCIVDERWHNFQVFAEWCSINYIDGFHLDKDILLKGNKIYNPETCCFVPQEINNLLTKQNKRRGKYPIGVSMVGNKYLAKIRKNNKLYELGRYNLIETAFNVYKLAKEEHIKEEAIFFKNHISDNVFNALLNYKIEITD